MADSPYGRVQAAKREELETRDESLKASEALLEVRLAEAAQMTSKGAEEMARIVSDREELASARESFAAERAEAEKKYSDRLATLEVAEVTMERREADLDEAEATSRVLSEELAARAKRGASDAELREKAITNAEEGVARLRQDLEVERARFQEQTGATKAEQLATKERQERLDEALRAREGEIMAREERVAGSEALRADLDREAEAIAAESAALAKVRQSSSAGLRTASYLESPSRPLQWRSYGAHGQPRECAANTSSARRLAMA